MPTYMARLGSGNVKIGHAKDVLRRIQTFQTAHTEKLTIIRVLDGGRETETALHEKFAHLRIEREWFRFADELTAPSAEFTDLPIPLPKRRAMADTASHRRWRMMEFVFSKLGGATGAAKKLGLPPWRQLSLRVNAEYHLSGLALLMQAHGYPEVSYQVLADLFHDTAVEENLIEQTRARARRVDLEFSFIERNGIEAVWWQLAPETHEAIAKKSAAASVPSVEAA